MRGLTYTRRVVKHETTAERKERTNRSTLRARQMIEEARKEREAKERKMKAWAMALVDEVVGNLEEKPL